MYVASITLWFIKLLTWHNWLKNSHMYTTYHHVKLCPGSAPGAGYSALTQQNVHGYRGSTVHTVCHQLMVMQISV